MRPTVENENVVRYQFQADDDDWQAWKETVPRSKSLEKRINELIEADTEGRVLPADAAETVAGALDDMLVAAERGDREAAEDAAERIREVVGRVE